MRLAAETAGPGTGCRVAPRCPRRLGKLCDDVPLPVLEPAPGHRIACHIPLAELRTIEPVFGSVER